MLVGFGYLMKKGETMQKLTLKMGFLSILASCSNGNNTTLSVKTAQLGKTQSKESILKGSGAGNSAQKVVKTPDEVINASKNAIPGPLTANGMRRLSPQEYDRTVNILFSLDVKPGDVTRSKVGQVFENESAPLDGGGGASPELARSMAGDGISAAEKVSAAFLANAKVFSNFVPCFADTTTVPKDCISSFVIKAGEMLWRRPITTAESGQIIQSSMSLANMILTDKLFPKDKKPLHEIVSFALEALLTSPYFQYRVELGTLDAASGQYKLDAFEIASRMSFAATGAPPNAEILDLAKSGKILDPQTRKTAFLKLASSDTSSKYWQAFVASWLRYDRVEFQEKLGKEARVEADAMVDNTLFKSKLGLTDLMSTETTFLPAALAKQYSMDTTAAKKKTFNGIEVFEVQQEGQQKAGILRTMAFLQNGTSFGETSPTKRGVIVLSRLFCKQINPPENVNVDEPIATNSAANCKKDGWLQIRTRGASCATCHKVMDEIGFVLEQYDNSGQFRTTQANKSSCTIDGKGDLKVFPTGALIAQIDGISSLAQNLSKNAEVLICSNAMLTSYLSAKTIGSLDPSEVAGVSQSLAGAENKFLDGLANYISSDIFTMRKESK